MDDDVWKYLSWAELNILNNLTDLKQRTWGINIIIKYHTPQGPIQYQLHFTCSYLRLSKQVRRQIKARRKLELCLTLTMTNQHSKCPLLSCRILPKLLLFIRNVSAERFDAQTKIRKNFTCHPTFTDRKVLQPSNMVVSRPD